MPNCERWFSIYHSPRPHCLSSKNKNSLGTDFQAATLLWRWTIEAEMVVKWNQHVGDKHQCHQHLIVQIEESRDFGQRSRVYIQRCILQVNYLNKASW